MPGNLQPEAHRSQRKLGIVQGIDLVGRDLAVLLQTGVEIFDIPPNCPIFLHGEKIKLRMVQPRDHVRVTFKRDRERLVAENLEVQPGNGRCDVQLPATGL